MPVGEGNGTSWGSFITVFLNRAIYISAIAQDGWAHISTMKCNFSKSENVVPEINSMNKTVFGGCNPVVRASCLLGHFETHKNHFSSGTEALLLALY